MAEGYNHELLKSETEMLDEIEQAIDFLDKKIKASFPRVKKIFIEAEAWKSREVHR